jgi:hypothetical protein
MADPISAFLVSMALGTGSVVVGAAVTGAIVGGVYAAVKGDNILKGAIGGAIIGAAAGAVFGVATGTPLWGAATTTTAPAVGTTEVGLTFSEQAALQTEAGVDAAFKTGSSLGVDGGVKGGSMLSKMTAGEKMMAGGMIAQGVGPVITGAMAEKPEERDLTVTPVSTERDKLTLTPSSRVQETALAGQPPTVAVQKPTVSAPTVQQIKVSAPSVNPFYASASSSSRV